MPILFVDDAAKSVSSKVGLAALSAILKLKTQSRRGIDSRKKRYPFVPDCASSRDERALSKNLFRHTAPSTAQLAESVQLRVWQTSKHK
jgi:hypothetical protein